MASRHAAYDDGVLRITHTQSPPGLEIAGEIDESTYAALVATLDRLANGHSELHINLAGVAYCDIAGLRAIVRLTGAGGVPGEPAEPGGAGPGRPGRRVILYHVPRQLLTLLQIIGWDSTPGLALAEALPS